jgi:hypothetical protein
MASLCKSIFHAVFVKIKINFMKKSLFIVLFIAAFQSLNAQIYPKGSTNFSVGFGAVSYGSLVTNLFSGELKDLNINKFGPMYFKGEYAVADNFTLGVNVNYTNTSGTFSLDSSSVVGKYSGTLGLRSTSIIGRVNYTFPFAEDRGGFMLGGGIGYRGFRVSYADTDPRTPVDGGFSFPIPFTGELTFGVRYYITENIGLYTEFGLTRSIIQGGITARF